MRRFLTLALVVVACSGPEPAAIVFDTGEITVGDNVLNVWVATEAEERRQGLRTVEELPDDIDGMLFSYSDEISATFTMKDTLIPLDIWWFDGEGVLIGSARMEPCATDSCTEYRSPGPIGWALETPAGTEQLAVGDVLSTTGTE